MDAGTGIFLVVGILAMVEEKRVEDKGTGKEKAAPSGAVLGGPSLLRLGSLTLILNTDTQHPQTKGSLP